MGLLSTTYLSYQYKWNFNLIRQKEKVTDDVDTVPVFITSIYQHREIAAVPPTRHDIGTPHYNCRLTAQPSD